MSSPAQDAYKTELQAKRLELLPRIAGLENLTLLVKPESLVEVQAALEERRRRLGKIETDLAALNDLAADGYPEMPPEAVEAAVLADLRAEKAEIDAAIGEFTEDQRATALNLSVDSPQPK